MATFKRKTVEPVKEEVKLHEEDIMLEDDAHFDEDLIDYYEGAADEMTEEMPEEIQEEKTEEVEKPEENEEEGVKMNLKKKLKAINDYNNKVVKEIEECLLEAAQKENATRSCVSVSVEALDYVLEFLENNELKVIEKKQVNCDVTELTISWE